MKKLSVRHRGGKSYEIGPSGIAPTVKVTAKTTVSPKKAALKEGKALWRRKHGTSVELPMRQKLMIQRGLLRGPA